MMNLLATCTCYTPKKINMGEWMMIESFAKANHGRKRNNILVCGTTCSGKSRLIKLVEKHVENAYRDRLIGTGEFFLLFDNEDTSCLFGVTPFYELSKTKMAFSVVELQGSKASAKTQWNAWFQSAADGLVPGPSIIIFVVDDWLSESQTYSIERIASSASLLTSCIATYKSKQIVFDKINLYIVINRISRAKNSIHHSSMSTEDIMTNIDPYGELNNLVDGYKVIRTNLIEEDNEEIVELVSDVVKICLVTSEE